ncbi:MAG TPA: DUF2845 domain-containing protein [Dongiaceae bacterium]|nr:DUF2845 domain-containing protein [Dongiaceae bacterium]
MRSTSFLLFGALFVTASSSAFAGSMRCGNQIINEGTSQYEVRIKCGEPVYQQLIEEPITVVTTTAASINSRYGYGRDQQQLQQDVLAQEVQPMYRNIERWTYNFGSGRLLREVDFYNGDVIRIETGGRAP